MEEASDGLDLTAGKLTILIENTAGAEYSLGSRFEQVAELIGQIGRKLPVAACIDTCHVHVSGYDLVSDEGYQHTLQHLDTTVGLQTIHVWHCNDAKAACGSHLDRHQHIGQGTMGLLPFRRLLNDPRVCHAAFIAETPIDQPGGDQRNVDMLKSLVDAMPATSTPGLQKER
jgi:deoxyribonuclease-4